MADGNEPRKTKTWKLINNRVGLFLLILGLALLLLPPVPFILAKPTTPSEPRSINELVNTLDIQIPGWQRLGNPKANPIVDKDNEVGFKVEVKFVRQKIQAINITLANYPKEMVDKLLTKFSKEETQTMDIKGFEAIKVSSQPSIYKDYLNILYIKVSDKGVLIINGRELLDFDQLIKVANMIDLNKLAELTK